MPRRDDIHKVLIIGSGPIVIGQACEFDYSGTQACKALRSLGYQTVLVNSNPATIMTDPVMADETYIEPLTVDSLERIIARSRPDALLPNLGGQTGLNLSLELEQTGILERYGVTMLGISSDAIRRGEDREQFKQTMTELGIEMPRSTTVTTVDDAARVAADLGYPVVLRPAYTMGGTGGGLVADEEQLRTVCARGLQASLVGQVLVEESVLGWEELEVEVVRDSADQMISVCFIENVDPMGVHTGDSYCNAPMQTICAELTARLQEIAYRIVSSIGVIGGTNVQTAHDPATGRVVVIEINPRTSRSSALASKATGFPIAYVSALLAAGLTLDELPYWRDGSLDRYTPDGDYVVSKFARWAFEKLPGSVDRLGTQMRAVGEVMSIAKSYPESFLKAIRALENGRRGLGDAPALAGLGPDQLRERLRQPSSERQYLMYLALQQGVSIDEVVELTGIKRWFVEQMAQLVAVEAEVASHAGDPERLDPELLRRAKVAGFGDNRLSQILGTDQATIRRLRHQHQITARFEAVPVSGVAGAEYYFSTYADPRPNPLPEPRPVDSSRPKVMVLGGGPNRIGQGIEFDYCCVHAAYTLREQGYATIMVNCNPETVSTDYDTSDRLYFEPLTVEDVLSIAEHERPDGVICQFGGQTPLTIAQQLKDAGLRIIGTSPETIDLAEDRDRFREIMDRLAIPMPQAAMATTVDEAVAVADQIGYPVIVRPSYVLGGRGMEIVFEPEALRRYMAAAQGVTPDRPILIDRFLENALECEADALCDGTDAYVPAVMEHIEYAGVHSGDSACFVPSVTIPTEQLRQVEDYTRRIAIELGVVGLLNVQYAISEDGTVYVLEANPRASRTVPLVSKVADVNMAALATRLMLGERLADLGLQRRELGYQGVKESVFPFPMFPEVDPLLGPEMRSTGEVLGLAADAGAAYAKAQAAAGAPLPSSGAVLISVAERDRVDKAGETILAAAQDFAAAGLRLYATSGTRAFLASHGLEATAVNKLHEGSPTMADLISDHAVDLVVNTPAGSSSEYDDSYIRKAAIRTKIAYITTTPGARAAAAGILAIQHGKAEPVSLQEYHRR